jgi:hypothetical protein
MLWQDKLKPPSPTLALAPDWFRRAKAAGESPEALRARVAAHCTSLLPMDAVTSSMDAVWIDLMTLLYEEAVTQE